KYYSCALRRTRCSTMPRCRLRAICVGCRSRRTLGRVRSVCGCPSSSSCADRATPIDVALRRSRSSPKSRRRAVMIRATMRAMTTRVVERGPGDTITEYDEVPVQGDVVERLMTEIFGRHWAEIFAGPVIEGAAYEIRFTTAPTLSMLDGYLTVDVGAWH